MHRFIIFYTCTLPFLSVLHTCTDAILMLWSKLNPLYSLIASVFFVCGWYTQVAFWMTCEASSPDGLVDASCPQHVFYYTSVSMQTVGARLAFGFIVPILYLIYLAVSASLVHRQRKDRKASLVKQDDISL